MAGKAKQRDFSPYIPKGSETPSDVLGVAQYEVKLPNGSTQAIDTVGPINFDAMLKHLSSLPTDDDGEKARKQAYTFHWRGIEAMAGQKVRLLNDTVVTIPGTSKTVDLMAIPPEVAVQAINAHDLGIKLLAAAAIKMQEADDDNDEEEMDEDTERAARKNRAWDNARRFLLESNKVIQNADGSLAMNPEYKATAIAGASDASDADVFLDMIEEPVKGRRKRSGK